MQVIEDRTLGLEELLEAEDRLLALHTPEVEAVLVEFRLLCRRSGRSIYHWSDDQGIVSLKAADITVPGCRKLTDAMRYVAQSMHYGVYLFTHFQKQLRPRVVELMRGIATMPDQRTVILLAERIELPGRLDGQVRHVALGEARGPAVLPRLRDGRWVL